jgi:hypothetical protein
MQGRKTNRRIREELEVFLVDLEARDCEWRQWMSG